MRNDGRKGKEMTLRIMARSKDRKKAYAEEVKNVKPIKANYLSLLNNPVEYTDRKGHCWNCEKSDIISSFDGVKIRPAICNGVYHLEWEE